MQTLVTSITHPLTIYATSRSGVNLAVQTPSNIEIKYPELDISSPSSVEAFAELVENAHDDVGVLINNAAAHDGDKTHSPEMVKHVIDTNVWGTLRVSNMDQSFLAFDSSLHEDRCAKHSYNC